MIAGYYAWRADHLQLTPQVQLEFANERPFVEPTGPRQTFVRVKVNCVSGLRANCEGHLLAVYQEVVGHFEPLCRETLDLTWAQLDQAGRLEIERDAPRLLNVCVQEGQRLVPCAARIPNTLLEQLSHPGTFRFQVHVTGKEPLCIQVKLAPSDTYHPLVELVPSPSKA